MSDMRNLLSKIEDLAQDQELMKVNDSFDIELSEDALIESGILGFTKNGVIIEGDDTMINLLQESGAVCTRVKLKEGKDNAGELTKEQELDEIKLKIEFYKLMGNEKAAAELEGILNSRQKKDIAEGSVHRISRAEAEQAMTLPDSKSLWLRYGQYTPEDWKSEFPNITDEEARTLSNFAEFGWQPQAPDKHILQGRVVHAAKALLNNNQQNVTEGPADEPVEPDDDFDDPPPGWDTLRDRFDSDEMTYRGPGHEIPEPDEYGMSMNKVIINGKPVVVSSVEVDGVDTRDYPDFSDAYATYAEFENGAPLSDKELELLQNKYSDVVRQAVEDSLFEAKYQGRTVSLNKPTAGDVKKRKVYVRKPNGNIVKVEFGDKNMRIKKSNPARRKSFRARHRCDNPGPKWKARYWSCRFW